MRANGVFAAIRKPIQRFENTQSHKNLVGEIIEIIALATGNCLTIAGRAH